MKGKRLAAGIVALGLVVWSASARAGDTVRLNLTDKDAPTINLVDDGQEADTILTGRGGFHGGVAVRGGGYYGGAGFRGGYRYGGVAVRGGGYYGGAGYRAGYRYGGYGYRGYYGARVGYGYGYRGYYGYGYRPWYGYGYRPWYGYGYRPWYGYGYRPWYGYGVGYYPGYYGGYYPSYGGYATYGFYNPCAYGPTVTYSTTIPGPSVAVDVGPSYGTPAPGAASPAPAEEGTYPYDGGPARPVPAPGAMPRADPTAAPVTPTLPLEGRPVSLPKALGKWAYAAYGEPQKRTTFGQDRDLLIKR